MVVIFDFERDEAEIEKAHYLFERTNPLTQWPSYWDGEVLWMPIHFQTSDMHPFWGTAGTAQPGYRLPLVATAYGMEFTLWRVESFGAWDFMMPDESQDVVMLLTGHNVLVKRVGHSPVARVPLSELREASAQFSGKVRGLIRTEFPELLEHPDFGWWFRGEPAPAGSFFAWGGGENEAEESRRVRRFFDSE